MRLSRKVLTGLVGVGAVVVFGALIWALYQGNRKPGSGSELYNTENKTTPDGLTTLPRDYSGLPQNPTQGAPQLGPPVPGDIGRPQPAPGAEGVDPEQQRLAQETEAARTSRLFATTGVSVDQRLTPVILCGGAGTRLGPVSREKMPKHFVPLFGSLTTFQQVLDRSPAIRCSQPRSSSATRISASWSPNRRGRAASLRRSFWSRCAGILLPPLRPRPNLPSRAMPTRFCWW
jgi:type IV secretory pathway VirB10-like protein